MNIMEHTTTVSGSETEDQTHRLYPSLTAERLELCLMNQLSPNHLDLDPDLDRDLGLDLGLDRVLGLERGRSARGAGDRPSDSQDEDKGRVSRMKAQIGALEIQKQELLSINEKWAKEYHTMVQYYKDKLLSKKAALPEETCHDSGGQAPHKHRLSLLKDAAAGCGDALAKTQSEARALQEQNRALTRRGQHQEKEITRLNRALEEALETSSSRDMSSETLQDIWKHQCEVYKEDFLKERKDREALKQKYLQLEEKYKRVRKELYVLKAQLEPECTCSSNKQTGPDKPPRRYT